MDKHLNVLLVDDDEDEYILIKGMFARLPGQGNGLRYSLDWASSFDQALTVCQTKKYDIHLVDYYLGRYNGLDLMRAVEKVGCSAPFILLTGQGSYELDLTAMEQGVSDYLLKDQINEHLLERSIRYALERYEAQAELENRVRERTRELAAANDVLREEMAHRARIETILRESEERFRTLAETTSAAIFIVQDQLIRYANPAARYITGYSVEDLLDTPLWRLAHPNYQAPFQQERLSTHWADNVPARYEIKIITRRGEERWVDVTAGQMKFEGRSAWLITAFDITERDLAEKALRRAKDELEQRVLDRTAEIQATSNRLQAVLDTLPVGLVIADQHGEIVQSNRAYQNLLDREVPEDGMISAWLPEQAWWSESGEQLEQKEWPLWRAIRQGESTIDRVIDILSGEGRRKTIIHSAVPIRDPGGQVVGGVAVAQDISNQRQLEQEAQFAAREAMRQRELAQAAARESQQRADELDGLHRATAALLSTLDLDELLCQILDAAQSAIPAAERGMLHLISPTTGRLQVRATLGFSNERIRVIHSPNSQDYSARVVRSRTPLLIHDAQAEGLPEGSEEEHQEIRSMIIAPLHVGDQMLGALSLSAINPGAFTESNLRLLVSFAATTTAALQNAILHAEVKQLAVLDPLTGLYNRRAFFDLGQRELERFLRFNHPLTAVMIDMDNFKEINDTYGHAAGDQILRILGERVQQSIRETDVFGRYGGDEFALLLPDSDLFAAGQIGDRIRAAINEIPWVTDRGEVPVAASMGIARAEKRHRRLEDLLSDADKALYGAKANGRNRVEIFQAL